MVVEVERFAWKELMLLTGVATVEEELEDVATVVLLGEDEDKATDFLVR